MYISDGCLIKKKKKKKRRRKSEETNIKNFTIFDIFNMWVVCFIYNIYYLMTGFHSLPLTLQLASFFFYSVFNLSIYISIKYPDNIYIVTYSSSSSFLINQQNVAWIYKKIWNCVFKKVFLTRFLIFIYKNSFKNNNNNNKNLLQTCLFIL